MKTLHTLCLYVQFYVLYCIDSIAIYVISITESTPYNFDKRVPRGSSRRQAWHTMDSSGLGAQIVKDSVKEKHKPFDSGGRAEQNTTQYYTDG